MGGGGERGEKGRYCVLSFLPIKYASYNFPYDHGHKTQFCLIKKF